MKLKQIYYKPLSTLPPIQLIGSWQNTINHVSSNVGKSKITQKNLKYYKKITAITRANGHEEACHWKTAGVVCASSLNLICCVTDRLGWSPLTKYTMRWASAWSHYTITTQIRFRSKSNAYCSLVCCRQCRLSTIHWIGVGRPPLRFFAHPYAQYISEINTVGRYYWHNDG